MGSGAVFFDLFNAGRLSASRVRLVDVNPDLIGCYTTVRDHTEAVIAALDTLDREHGARGDACYYDVRVRFNRIRGQTPIHGATQPGELSRGWGSDPQLAAMLIYLNRTGFNGLFRVNRSGEFNVPVGRYANPRICDAEHLRAVARAFSAKRVTLECLGFEEALADAGPGDFVYCDPPYAPLSRTSSFAHYTAGGFSALDHERLQRAIIDAAGRGAIVLVSNSSAQEIEKAYRSAGARKAGLVVRRVAARRTINSRATLRGAVDELIISNALSAIRPRMLRARYPDQLAAGRTRKRKTQV